MYEDGKERVKRIRKKEQPWFPKLVINFDYVPLNMGRKRERESVSFVGKRIFFRLKGEKKYKTEFRIQYKNKFSSLSFRLPSFHHTSSIEISFFSLFLFPFLEQTFYFLNGNCVMRV